MSYVIYNTNTTILLTDKRYATERAAKSARTRLLKKAGDKYADQDFSIAEAKDFYQNIELMVERVNLMSGKKYMESVNTPSYCSPSCEAYWSM
jgi:hypothetical protein